MLHGKCLICFISLSFLCFDKELPGSPGNILRMGGLAQKLEKSDRTLMDVTHSNLNFIFDFHLASLLMPRKRGPSLGSSTPRA